MTPEPADPLCACQMGLDGRCDERGCCEVREIPGEFMHWYAIRDDSRQWVKGWTKQGAINNLAESETEQEGT